MSEEAGPGQSYNNAHLHRDIGRLEERVTALSKGLEQSNERTARAFDDISKKISDLADKHDDDDESTRAVLNQIVGRGQMAVWFFSALMALGGLATAVYNIFWK